MQLMDTCTRRMEQSDQIICTSSESMEAKKEKEQGCTVCVEPSTRWLLTLASISFARRRGGTRALKVSVLFF